MFNKSWYPTPKKLARKISSLIDWGNINSILDPSAGKGDLLTGILCSELEYYSHNKEEDPDAICLELNRFVKIYAIEIDPALRGILNNYRLLYNRGVNKINVIGSNFFEYSGQYKIDCIVINPPFENADEHLLKAIDIMKDGGQIICILNQETIKNPYSKKRKILKEKLKKYNVKIIDVGNPFKTAYRKTNVKCVIVNIEIPKIKDMFNFPEENITRIKDEDFTINNASEKFIVSKDAIKTEVLRHEKEIEVYKDCLKYIYKLRQYGGEAFKEIEDYKQSLNNYILKSTSNAWKHLISFPRFTRFMTRKTRRRFLQQVNSNSLMEFTENNIYQFLDALIYSYTDIMYESLIDIFDLFTSYDKQNKIECEGWWTNDAYKVNRKVIIPGIWGYLPSMGYSLCYKMKEIINDIDRIMMWLSGEKLKDVNNPDPNTDFTPKYIDGIADTLKKADCIFGIVHNSYFFTFRVYKKPAVMGTMHLEFKNERLWQEFNLRAAEKKNWLPDDYKNRRKDVIKRGFLLEYK